MTLTYKRQDYHKVEVERMIDEKVSQNLKITRASFREVNEFIQSFHNEFKDYIHATQKERTGMVRHL